MESVQENLPLTDISLMSLLWGQLEWVGCAVNSSSPSLREWDWGPWVHPATHWVIPGTFSIGATSIIAETQYDGPRGLQKHNKEGNTNMALRCIIDVWLHWELGSLKAFFSRFKKNLLPFKKINKVGSMLRSQVFVGAVASSVSGVFQLGQPQEMAISCFLCWH